MYLTLPLDFGNAAAVSHGVCSRGTAIRYSFMSLFSSFPSPTKRRRSDWQIVLLFLALHRDDGVQRRLPLKVYASLITLAQRFVRSVGGISRRAAQSGHCQRVFDMIGFTCMARAQTPTLHSAESKPHLTLAQQRLFVFFWPHLQALPSSYVLLILNEPACRFSTSHPPCFLSRGQPWLLVPECPTTLTPGKDVDMMVRSRINPHLRIHADHPSRLMGRNLIPAFILVLVIYWR